jgi:two-component system response regulator AtoC
VVTNVGCFSTMQNTCLIVDCDREHASRLRAFCESIGFRAIIAETLAGARDCILKDVFDAAFLDLDLPDGSGMDLLDAPGLRAAEIMVMATQDEPVRADRAVGAGASYFFCKPFQPDRLRALLEDIIKESGDREKGAIPAEPPGVMDQFGYLRGSCPRMRRLYRLVRKVAPTDLSLLLIGETGTGKEVLARTIHEFSSRAGGPFIAFNCASVAETLIESELFGHERGSFSGAGQRHRGFFERAAGGTLMLDEITEMNGDLQARLLRVLEERKLRRIGSESDIGVDVRILSATNRAPAQAMKEGRLRRDLYYRLAQFPLRLPPLRERGEDICGLAQYFLNELNARHDTDLSFSTEALDRIFRHSWPGNVRELKHAVERAYIVSEALIEAGALPDPARDLQVSAGDLPNPASLSAITLAETERLAILAALERNGGDKKRTAAELGISLKTLYNRLKAYAEEPVARPPG